jgi:hypothetical protein
MLGTRPGMTAWWLLAQLSELFPARSIGPFGRRQKYAHGNKIPVTLVTGFLGAGKTTLLRRFLTTPEGAGTAIVVNEFGSEGIDDALLRASSDETVLLGNGCLCCFPCEHWSSTASAARSRISAAS